MSAHILSDRDRLVRLSGRVMAAIFAAVGLVFLVIPGRVLALFNEVGEVFGLPASPTDAFTLYLALAVAYMYVVTLLAWQMARRPRDRSYPWLLVNAKAASAVVCLILFVVQDHCLIYAANALVDGVIAAAVWGVALRGPQAEDVAAHHALGGPGPRRDHPSAEAAVPETTSRVLLTRGLASGTRDGFAVRG